uniref:Exonuclease domain-containing protein n=1 Tax=Peromyscus maniculatus bairdii TaxID=230844 RepID=A0A8C8UC91_PERMB
MLHSTGSIDCPYWVGAPGEPCQQPYSHFRQCGASDPGAPGSGGAVSPAAGLGYDLHNQELPQPPAERENGTLGQGDGMLELIKQAIEAVHSKIELEQRRYQELLEMARGHGAGASALAPGSPAMSLDDEDTFSLALPYTPGGLLSPDSGYQPTPLAAPAEQGHKYSLAPSERGQGRVGGGTSALEYVPKAVGQPRHCGRPASGGKYVVDRSKPSTDLEYDPLSNYSVRYLGRASARDERATKRPQGSPGAEPYTPAIKKPCGPFSSCEAKFSDSEDEVASPAKVDVTSPKAGAEPESKAPGKPASKEGPEPMEGSLPGAKEIAAQHDVEDFGQPPKAADTVARASHNAGVPKDGKAKKKKSGTPASLNHKDKARKRDKKKDKDPGWPREKEKVSANKKRPPAGGPQGKAQGSEGTKKKPSNTTTVASSGKGGPGRPASGGPRPQDSGSGSHAPLAWKVGSDRKTPSGKLVGRKAGSLDKGAPQEAPKLKKRALSYTELFGDESEEEDSGLEARVTQVWPPTMPSFSSDSESDSDSSLGFGDTQVPKCLKAKPPASPAPPSPLPSSSSSFSCSSGASQCSEEDVDYSALEKEVDFDADPMEECLRIFNESTSVKTEDKARPPTAQEVCYRRAQQAQKDSASWLQVAPRPTDRLSSVLISAPGEKRRIAHVPNPLLATTPKGAKRALPASSSQVSHGPEPGNQPLKTCTLSGMASKTTTTVTPKRIAHRPSLQSLKKPIIPKEFGGKVPTVVRQRYLNLFIKECLKFCPSNQEAIEKALKEEKVAYERSSSKNIYLNVAVNTLKKLRGLVPNTVPSLSKASGRRVVSHEVVLGGRLAAKTSFSLSRPSSPRVEELKGNALYNRLREYLLTQEQLKENGYPFPHPERPGGAVIFTAQEKKPKDPSCRICCRCGTKYLVSSSGRCVRNKECYYHWGLPRQKRVAGGWETQYKCCSAAVGSVGCQVAKQHVQDGRKENLDGFVRTFQKELPKDSHAGVFALDCEMSYTTYGLELTRVTVVDTDMQVVYDTFVKPDNEVVDYNTRFSGVTEADLEDTSITLRDVQAVLLSMFSADTILIGHSLESDLLALKIIHGTVVDTSVLFPHRLGLPHKRALRNLMADYLRQIIQDNVDGHSSSEDASACMHLVIWKIREDAKTKR